MTSARGCAPLLALLVGCSSALPTDEGLAPDDAREQATGVLQQDVPADPAGDPPGDEPPDATPDATPSTCTPPASTGTDACSAPLKPGDDRLCEYSFGGRPRKYYVYAPPSFDPCKPASLVMDAHGASESIEVHVGKAAFNPNRPKGYGSGWRRAIQGDNAIVVTPQGISNRWSAQTDVPFLNDIVDRVSKTAQVDKQRVYMTGISMGGMISFATACANTERWRGISAIAPLNPTCSRIARPLPVIDFHATGDALTSYQGSQRGMETMARLNGCKKGPTKFVSYGGANTSADPVCFKNPPRNGGPDAADPFNIPLAACPSSARESSCVKWEECNEGVEVVFCTVNAQTQELGGHLLYTNDTGLNVAVVSWNFFKKFQK